MSRLRTDTTIKNANGKALGIRIKQRRTELNMTGEKLAKKSKIFQKIFSTVF